MTMKNKKRIAISAAALAGCLVIGGTFAWFSTTDKVTNKFDMDAFDVAITEDFDQNPDVPLVPGADITKSVTVTNSGNMDVVVRVKLEEMLQLLERYTDNGNDKLKVTYTSSDSASDGQVAVVMSDEMIEAYKTAGYKVLTNASASDGEEQVSSTLPDDVTVLRKTTTASQEGANTVYSYIAYVTEGKQVVKITPVIGTGSKETPESFKAEYAYHTYKDSDDNGGNGITPATGIHGKDDATLDSYYGGRFHDAVVLNFAANVDVDGGALGEATTWYLGDDGYFYYTQKLAGNTISAPLLESVSIAEDAANALQGAKYELTPVMEATQADHEAVTGNWTDLSYTQEETDTVSDNDATGIKQMIANILNTGKGYKGN